ncbi:uncharacterized protein LOC135811505 isoform X2 [Sycon ciliatum]|uniref:uncharacterized protein LOC135811505 isoform X2 n=1 Tax=Sycon ciliatum TaxID=27933 RepID=UPI0031F71053
MKLSCRPSSLPLSGCILVASALLIWGQPRPSRSTSPRPSTNVINRTMVIYVGSYNDPSPGNRSSPTNPPRHCGIVRTNPCRSVQHAVQRVHKSRHNGSVVFHLLPDEERRCRVETGVGTIDLMFPKQRITSAAFVYDEWPCPKAVLDANFDSSLEELFRVGVDVTFSGVDFTTSITCDNESLSAAIFHIEQGHLLVQRSNVFLHPCVSLFVRRSKERKGAFRHKMSSSPFSVLLKASRVLLGASPYADLSPSCNAHCVTANVVDIETFEAQFQVRFLRTVFMDTRNVRPVGNNAIIQVNTVSKQHSLSENITEQDTIPHQLVEVSLCAFRSICHRDVVRIITTQGYFSPVPARKIFSDDILSSQQQGLFTPQDRSGTSAITVRVKIWRTKFLDWDCAGATQYDVDASEKPHFLSLVCHFSPLFSTRVCRNTLAEVSNCEFHNAQETDRQMIVAQGFQLNFTGANKFRGLLSMPLRVNNSAIRISGRFDTDYISRFINVDIEGSTVRIDRISDIVFAVMTAGLDSNHNNMDYALSIFGQYEFDDDYRPLGEIGTMNFKASACIRAVTPAYIFSPDHNYTDPPFPPPICQLYMSGLPHDSFLQNDTASSPVASAGGQGSQLTWYEDIRVTSKHVLCSSSATRPTFNFLVVDGKDVFRYLGGGKASWLLLEMASSQAIKILPRELMIFTRGFWSHDIWNAVADTRLLGRVQLSSILPSNESVLNFLKQRSQSATNVIPGPATLFSPWAHVSGYSWSHGLHLPDLHVEPACKMPAFGDLLLYPAPGEVMTFSLDMLDDLLSSMAATIWVEIRGASKAQLLTDKGLAITDSFMEVTRPKPFLSTAFIHGLAIAGHPGTTGVLQFTVRDGGVVSTHHKPLLSLDVPFLLRQCYPGFQKMKKCTGKDECKDVNKAATKVCECSSQPGIAKCHDDHAVTIKEGYWAGFLGFQPHTEHKANRNLLISLSSTTNNSIDSLLTAAGAGHDGDSATFVVVPCRNTLCVRRAWRYGIDNACTAHSAGPLCSKCEDGWSLKVAQMECVDCRNSTKISLSVYVPSVAGLTLLSAFLLFYFNIGLNPLLDSCLFFLQAYSQLGEKTTIFPTLLTFGLGHICLKENLKHLQIEALLLVQPLTMLLVFVVIRLLRSYKQTAAVLQRQQHHLMLVHVMWFVFVYSYFMLVYVSISFLWFVSLDGQLVLQLDSSVTYFGAEHAPYAATSILIVILLVIPIPVILALPCARSVSMLRGFIDEAFSLYRHDRWYWAAFNLLRRVVLVCLVEFTHSQPLLFTIVTVCFFWLQLLAHALAWPLRPGTVMRLSYNTWECLLSLLLCLICTVQFLFTAFGHDKTVLDRVELILVIIPLILLLPSSLFQKCKSEDGMGGRLRRSGLHQWWVRQRDEQRRAAGRDRPLTMLNERGLAGMAGGLRESLIEDQIREQQEQQRSLF